MQDAAYRRCRKCGEGKPPDEFHRDRTRTDGRSPYCRACKRERELARYWGADGPPQRAPSRIATPVADLDASFANWLAGFIDGEGCFTIARSTHGGYVCRMMIKVRDDDMAILEEIAHRTGIGYTSRNRPYGSTRRANPAAIWNVGTRADCVALVALLDRFPLRAKKARDYAIWREAVIWWVGDRRRGNRHYRDWAPIAEMDRRLREVRVYAG
jgi:hypothetical protein